MHTESLIDSLLFEEEGTELDFKRDQYPFDSADERQKSELLKDILAFANAWRRSDAYILIGIQEVKGGPSTVFGVSGHLDDAKLQQFVNSKTNQPIEFSYNPMLYRSAQIGVIHLPMQDHRPFFLLKDYGALRRDTVYIRRGSSTDTARPDEIAKMGMVVDTLRARPQLAPKLVSGAHWTDLTETVVFESVCLKHEPIDALPDYRLPEASGPLGIPMISLMKHANRDFYRERAEYLRFYSKLRAIKFAVENSGTALASGVKVSVLIDDPDGNVELALGSDRPVKPKKEWSLGENVHAMTKVPSSDINLSRTRTGWVINALLGKIQAKDTALSSELLFIGIPISGSVQLSVSVFADELSSPVRAALTVEFSVSEKELSYEHLVQ